MKPFDYPVQGAGLGLRRALMGPLRSRGLDGIDFMEIAPENWMGVGGRPGRSLKAFVEDVPFVCHGLSLSIGGPAPLDEPFIRKLGRFLDAHNVRCYSEHLSFCSDDGHLYDLMPIPFTGEAVDHVARRVRQVQETLGRRIALENVSYYAAPGAELSESEFINAVLEEADCDLLLDVNNVYVNSVNHAYDPLEFLGALPGHRIAYGHIAGHHNEADDLIVDTHGAEVVPDVWRILDYAFETFGVFPVLLERDFNFPPVDELLAEVGRIRSAQLKWQAHAGKTRQRA
jgi:uncharacterized protein (UPF0276 family)